MQARPGTDEGEAAAGRGGEEVEGLGHRDARTEAEEERMRQLET